MTTDTQHLQEKLCCCIFLRGDCFDTTTCPKVLLLAIQSNSAFQGAHFRSVCRNHGNVIGIGMTEKFREWHGYASWISTFGLPSGAELHAQEASFDSEGYCYLALGSLCGRLLEMLHLRTSSAHSKICASCIEPPQNSPAKTVLGTSNDSACSLL